MTETANVHGRLGLLAWHAGRANRQIGECEGIIGAGKALAASTSG